MSDVINETVISEKFRNMEKEVEQLKASYNKLEEKVNETEKKADKIDNQLSIKLIQLETKLDYHTKTVGEKVDNLAKEFENKMDEYFKPKNSNVQTDSFKEYVTRLGMKLFEYGIYGGILYAVAKGLKLF